MRRWLLMCGFALLARPVGAEPPLKRPDLDRPVIGLTVSEDLAAVLAEKKAKNKPKAGVFVTSVQAGSPLAGRRQEFPRGAIVSRIDRTPVRTIEEFDVAVAALTPGTAAQIETSLPVRSGTIGQRLVVWAVAKKVEVTPVRYVDLVQARVAVEKDGFLNEWHAVRVESPIIDPYELRVSYQVKEGQSESLSLQASVVQQTWLHTEAVEIKVGGTIHRLLVTPTKSLTPSYKTMETWTGAVTGETLAAMQDIAFGQGECAIKFVGRDRAVARPITPECRESVRLTLIAYSSLGHPDILPVE